MRRDYLPALKNAFIDQLRGIYVSHILIVLVVAAILVIVPGYIRIQKKKENSWFIIICRYFWVSYTGIILLITIIRRGVGTKAGKIVTYLQLGSLTGGWYSLRQAMYCVLNVMLFVPFGFFYRLSRTREGSIRAVVMTTLTSFIFSFLIEFFQFGTRSGYFEVTDIVTNVTGGFVGAILGSLALIAIRGCKKNGEKNAN